MDTEKAEIAYGIVMELLHVEHDDYTEKTLELYDAAADYLIDQLAPANISLEYLKDELGLDYEDDEDLD